MVVMVVVVVVVVGGVVVVVVGVVDVVVVLVVVEVEVVVVVGVVVVVVTVVVMVVVVMVVVADVVVIVLVVVLVVVGIVVGGVVVGADVVVMAVAVTVVVGAAVVATAVALADSEVNGAIVVCLIVVVVVGSGVVEAAVVEALVLAEAACAAGGIGVVVPAGLQSQDSPEAASETRVSIVSSAARSSEAKEMSAKQTSKMQESSNRSMSTDRVAWFSTSLQSLIASTFRSSAQSSSVKVVCIDGNVVAGRLKRLSSSEIEEPALRPVTSCSVSSSASPLKLPQCPSCPPGRGRIEIRASKWSGQRLMRTRIPKGKAISRLLNVKLVRAASMCCPFVE
mmetsp:Transcript_94296/g.196850  ORF Transcript_94296/g.196850 Transcript_94296/m.196850 type:complete len:337 (-) Transcript_94296:581-1591(-)